MIRRRHLSQVSEEPNAHLDTTMLVKCTPPSCTWLWPSIHAYTKNSPKCVRPASATKAHWDLWLWSRNGSYFFILFSPFFTRPFGDDGYWMAHTKISNEMMLNERTGGVKMNDGNIRACTKYTTWMVQNDVRNTTYDWQRGGRVLILRYSRTDSLFHSFGSDWFRLTVPRFDSLQSYKS